MLPIFDSASPGRVVVSPIMFPGPSRRQWIYPMVALSAIALTLSVSLFSIDYYLDDAAVSNPFRHYWSFDSEAVSNSIGVMSSIIAAVLGIVITVVSIVVQLAATRYSPAVTEMFLRDKTNLFVMSIYVVGCVMGFWISFGVNTNWVPRVSLITMLATSTMGFVLMVPYFAYVFRFLEPQNVVARITMHAQQAAVENSGQTGSEDDVCTTCRSATRNRKAHRHCDQLHLAKRQDYRHLLRRRST